MKKILFTSVLSLVLLGSTLSVTGRASALINSVKSENSSQSKKVRYGKDFDDEDKNRNYSNNDDSDDRKDGYGNVNCKKIEVESDVNDRPDKGEIHLNKDGKDDRMSFNNDTKVFGGNWKDLDDKPRVIVKARKCPKDPKPVCESINIVKKGHKKD